MIELTRRDFLKLCLTTALTAGVLALVRDKALPIVKALERAEKDVEPLHLVWIECGDCAGDTIALTDAAVVTSSLLSKRLQEYGVATTLTLSGTVEKPELKIGKPEWWRPPLNSDLVYVLLGVGAKLDFHQTIMPEWGSVLEVLGKTVTPVWPAWSVKYLEDIVHEIEAGKPRPYALVIEGSIIDEVFYARKYGGWNSILGEKRGGEPCTVTEWIFKLCRGALLVAAVGTCAAYGGMPANWAPDIGSFSMAEAATHSPSGSMGFFPDKIKGTPGFIEVYREYAHRGELKTVWGWSSEEDEVFRHALDPYYEFAINKAVPELNWNAKAKLCVAVPGCPANGNAISLTLAACLLLYLSAQVPTLRDLVKVKLVLDEYWRPKYIRVRLAGEDIIDFPLFGYKLHARPETQGYIKLGNGKSVSLEVGCPKFVKYEAGQVKSYPADGSGKCLYSVGCKGPVCTCPWNTIGWILDYDLSGEFLAGDAAPGACTKTGAPCIGCVMPGFSDAYEPFFAPAAAPVMPGMLETVATLAVPAAVGAAAAVGLRQHIKSRIEKATAGSSSGSGSERSETGSVKEEKQEAK